ncbi:hypothetical protein [Actinomadura flavalba]|nr:hypothetical protein [Actinomadura flavalba]
MSMSADASTGMGARGGDGPGGICARDASTGMGAGMGHGRARRDGPGGV